MTPLEPDTPFALSRQGQRYADSTWSFPMQPPVIPGRCCCSWPLGLFSPLNIFLALPGSKPRGAKRSKKRCREKRREHGGWPKLSECAPCCCEERKKSRGAGSGWATIPPGKCSKKMKMCEVDVGIKRCEVNRSAGRGRSATFSLPPLPTLESAQPLRCRCLINNRSRSLAKIPCLCDCSP